MCIISRKAPPGLPALIVCIIASTLISVYCRAQAPYQRRLITTATDGSMSKVIGSYVADSMATLVMNSGFLQFNINTGVVNGARSVKVAGLRTNFTAGYLSGNSMYLVGTPGNAGSEYDTTYLFKYDILSSSFLWAKAFSSFPTPAMFSSITGNNGADLYLSGTSFDTATSTNVVLAKTDTNGNLIWVKGYGDSSDFVSPPSLSFLGGNQLYLSFISWKGTIYGSAGTVRVDENGTVISASGIVNPAASPRFAECFPTIIDGKLCTAYSTYRGPSDGGPTLLRVTDSSCNTVTYRTISGVQPMYVASDGNNMALSGQGYVTSGVPGFRTIRFDRDLNVLAANHYHKIPTTSLASTTYSRLLPSGMAIHCFKHGSDSIHIMLADEHDRTYCRDTAFNPGTNPPVVFSPTALSLSSLPISCHATIVYPGSITFSDLPVYVDDECALPNSVANDVNTSSNTAPYPNPATNELYLPEGTISAVIYGADGRIIRTSTYAGPIDISTLAAGVYLIRIQTSTTERTARFTKL